MPGTQLIVPKIKIFSKEINQIFVLLTIIIIS